MKKIFVLMALLMQMLAASAQDRTATPAEVKELVALFNKEMESEFVEEDFSIRFQDVDKDGNDEAFVCLLCPSGIGGIVVASKHKGKYMAEFSDMASNNGAYEIMKDGFMTYSYTMGRHVVNDFVFDDFSSCIYMKFVNSTLVYSLSYDEQLKEGVNADNVNEKNYEKSVVHRNTLTICGKDIYLSDADAKKLLPTE